MKKIIPIVFLLLLTGCTLFSKSLSVPDSSSDDSSVLPISQSQTAVEIPKRTEGLFEIQLGDYPKIYGSTANFPFMTQLAAEAIGIPLEDAAAYIPTVGGTGAVWEKIMWGEADMLIVYEPPTEIKASINFSEKDGKRTADIDGQKLLITPIGSDALVFILNKQNPLENLTQKQLLNIYTDKVTDWGDVGGTQGKISAFQRNADSGSQTLFLKLLFGGKTPAKPPSELVSGTMGSIIEAVSAFDGGASAIGFSVFYYASEMFKNENIKIIAVDGVMPSNESIKSGEYPFVNDFYVVIKENEPDGTTTRRLYDFLTGEGGKEMLTKTGYVAVQR